MSVYPTQEKHLLACDTMRSDVHVRTRDGG